MTHIIIYYLGILTFIYLARTFFIVRKTKNHFRTLIDTKPLTAAVYPKVSIVVAARNEERSIEVAMRSLLAQDYPNFELLVVNDRSTDATEDILEKIETENPKLKLISVYQLPSGWLGKNHAMHSGIQKSTGDYILLTDADVTMEPTAVSRAMQLMLQDNIDHMAVAPDALMKEHILNIFLAAFSLTYTLFGRPWKISDPKSKSCIGIGAFNLFKKEIYAKIGTFEALRMRPDDDMRFGMLVKKNGFKQELVTGHGVVKVEWYSHLGELVQGLEKNSFAILDYNWKKTAVVCLLLFWFFVFPALGLLVTKGLNPIVCVLNFCLMIAIFYQNTKGSGLPVWYGFLFPLGGALEIFILVRSTYLVLKMKGLSWRGTQYSLDELKANKISW